MISQEVKEFIENNIDLIENEQFEDLYQNAVKFWRVEQSPIGELTMTLVNSDIDPLQHMNYVPPFFCYHYKGLMRFTIPSNCKMVSSFAFDDSALVAIEFDEGCETLETYSLVDCSELKRVVLPRSLKKICQSTFSNSDKLEEIIYNGTVNEWNKIEKETHWYHSCLVLNKVVCRDGEVDLPKALPKYGFKF